MSAQATEWAPLVQLRSVGKTYRMGEVDVSAVRGVTLGIQRGEFVALMGASGSGKSSLMNILGCLDKATTGEYILDGIVVDKLDRKGLARLRNRKLGFVFQNFNLLARTSALENVELPMLYSVPLLAPRTQRQRAMKALQQVGLSARHHHHPNQLSGGEQQRIAIARALVNEPELILADEPTGNLDSGTSAEVMGILKELNNGGVTIIVVTHERDIAMYCRRHLTMRDGLLVSDLSNESRHNAHERPSVQQALSGPGTLDHEHL